MSGKSTFLDLFYGVYCKGIVSLEEKMLGEDVDKEFRFLYPMTL